MKPEHIKEVLHRQPFIPFRIRLSDGSSHSIHHPELLWVTVSLIGIASGVDDPATGVPNKAVLRAPEHIVAIELLNKSRSRAA